MKKRILVLLMAVVLAVGGVFAGTGCASKETISSDANTLNVKIKSSGYGTDFIYRLKEQFEKTFEAEGYKINVLAPDTALSETKILQTIYTQKGDSGVDVFFSSVNCQSGVEGNYGLCLTDITEEVYKKQPIKFDGTTEEKTVEEKIKDMDFQGANVYKDKYYGVPYALAFGGLAVNETVLKSFDLEIPKTTNELFNCAQVIMSKATSPASVKPFTYSTSSNNYPISTVNPWLAQYEGEERFNQFWSFEDENGPMIDGENTVRCAEVFAFEGVEKVFEALFEMYDYNMAAQGSNSQSFTQAQGQIMKGDAVFYSVGSWMLNEEYVRWASKVKDVTFISIPVLSALGVKMFGEGTKYAMSETDCEKVLRAIIDGADENKTPEEIKPTLDSTFGKDFDTADILRVCQARGYAKNSSGNGAYLNVKSNKKDLAYKFLRFIASEDAGKLIAENTRTPSPFAMDCLKDSDVPFLKSLDNISSNRYFKMVTADSRGYRKEMGVNSMFMSYAGEYFANKVLDWRVSIFDDEDYSFRTTVTPSDGDTKYSEDIGAISVGGAYTRVPYTTCAKVFVKEIYEIAKDNLTKGLWKV